MSSARPWRRSRIATATAGTLTASVLALLVPTSAHAAALTGTITVTSPTNSKLAALTAKQVVVLTVSGASAPTLSEDNVQSLGLGPSPCDALTNYVVTNSTTITVKTPNNCPVGTGDIVITFTNGDTLTKTGGITFVVPPAIIATSDTYSQPVFSDNSAFLLKAKQQQRFGNGGGQVVRVRAKSDYAFSPSTASALAASMGGKAGTSVKVYNDADNVFDATTTTPISASTTGTNGNSMSFVTAAGMTTGDSGITLTQDGVSKTYLTASTGISIVAAPTVTSLSVMAGRAKATNISTVITGTNLPKLLADAQDSAKWAVKFCGVPITVATDVTAVNATGTAMTINVPVLGGVGTGPNPAVSDAADFATVKANGLATGLGTAVYAGTCPVTVTDVVNTQTSAITPGSDYTFLSE